MDEVAKKRSRFELLLRHAEIPGEMVGEYFGDGYIDRVEVNRTNSAWTLHIVKNKLLPQTVFLTFCKKIQQHFSHIASISFVIRYLEEVRDHEVIEEYWPLCVEWLRRELVSVNGWMAKARIETEGNKLTVLLLDSTSLELAKRKEIDQYIVRFYRDYFGRDVRVLLAVGESPVDEFERFLKEREEEDRLLMRSMIEEAEKEAKSKPTSNVDDSQPFVYGYEIKDQPVPIQDIQDEEKRITIQGMVFALEVKELRNGTTLYTFNLTDFSDSLSLKVFVKNKEDLHKMQGLREGKWLRARGKVEYDRFAQVPELVMIPNDLNEVAPPPERMDDAEEKRVEFHLHTNMSTMDAVTSITEYMKLAAKWGHKAIAITDHAGVQAFPEADKAAQKKSASSRFTAWKRTWSTTLCRS